MSITINHDTDQLEGTLGLKTNLVPRVVSAGTSSGTLTPNSSTTDIFLAEGLSNAVTLEAPTGTPQNGQKLLIRLKDDGTSRSITWTSTSGGYKAIGVTLPVSTTAAKTTYVGCLYNSSSSFWDIIAVGTES